MGIWDKLNETCWEDKYEEFDPIAAFGVELAGETDWMPIGRDPTQTCSDYLEQDPDDGSWRFESSQSTIAIVFVLILGLIGSVFYLATIVSLKNICFWIFVSVCGWLIFILFRATISRAYLIFDTKLGAFYKTPQTIRRYSGDVTQLKTYTPFSDIGALQLLEQEVTTEHSSYTAYELNIVRKNGKRTNLVCHGSYRKLAANAATLAEILHVPLWDINNLPEQQPHTNAEKFHGNAE